MSLESFLLILSLAAVTYATRFGGHIILARFGALHPRVEAGLDAVPGAVIAALVAPSVFAQGVPGAVAIGVVVVASYRFSMIWTIALSLAVLVGLRALLG